jgi:hypothetical protein
MDTDISDAATVLRAFTPTFHPDPPTADCTCHPDPVREHGQPAIIGRLHQADCDITETLRGETETGVV